MKKIFIQIHKITGSLMSLLFLMWCISGVLLIYVGFPHASRQERFEYLKFLNPEDFSNIQPLSFVTGERVELEKYEGTPVYRIYKGAKKQTIINAFTLDTINAFGMIEAWAIAENYTQAKVEALDSVNALDSWIPWTYYKPLLPFYKFYMNDNKHTRVYVSTKTGEIVQKTTRKSRWLGRIGAIPHWIYFKQLHAKANLRKQVVLWLGIISWLACISGIIVGFYRLKRNENNRVTGITVYKNWWYKWHHILGFAFGLFMMSFVLSGVLYVTGVPSWMARKKAGKSPMSIWNKGQSNATMLAPALVWEQLPNKMGVRRLAWGVNMDKPVVKAYYDGYKIPKVYFVENKQIQSVNVVKKTVMARAEELFGSLEFTIIEQADYDYYYSNLSMYKRPLPIYKLQFNDTFKTCLYINPLSGEAMQYYDNNKRMRRLLTRGLHRFDFPFSHNYSALRKGILILFMLGGIILSITSIWLSIKWLKRLRK